MATKYGPTRRAVNRTVRAAESAEDPRPGLDPALIATAQELADHIGAATASGDPARMTKAIYLTPHLTNVLTEMHATPKARAEVAKTVPHQPGGALRAIKGGRS